MFYKEIYVNIAYVVYPDLACHQAILLTTMPRGEAVRISVSTKALSFGPPTKSLSKSEEVPRPIWKVFLLRNQQTHVQGPNPAKHLFL